MSIVYQSEMKRGRKWQELCRAMDPEREFHLWPECGDPNDVRYLITWQPPRDLVDHFPNLQVLFSIGAGVDQLDIQAIPDKLPIVRMIDHNLTRGMVEYASCAALALHRDLPLYLEQQRKRTWLQQPQRMATNTRVGVMGLGELGRAVLAQLKMLGFSCRGWSRSPRNIEDVRTFSGSDGFVEFLKTTDILVCLLPLTEETRGIIDAELLFTLPRGAGLIHVGRGGQLVSEDLIKALNRGQLRAAIVDVVDPEPLPENHPLWTHEKVWLTPHVASATQSESAFKSIHDNILRYESNQPMIGVVDRARGY